MGSCMTRPSSSSQTDSCGETPYPLLRYKAAKSAAKSSISALRSLSGHASISVARCPITAEDFSPLRLKPSRLGKLIAFSSLKTSSSSSLLCSLASKPTSSATAAQNVASSADSPSLAGCAAEPTIMTHPSWVTHHPHGPCCVE